MINPIQVEFLGKCTSLDFLEEQRQKRKVKQGEGPKKRRKRGGVSKNGSEKLHQEEGTSDVFEFLNSLGNRKTEKDIKKKEEQQKSSTQKTLNVQLVEVQDNIKKLQNEILALKKIVKSSSSLESLHAPRLHEMMKQLKTFQEDENKIQFKLGAQKGKKSLMNF